MHLGWGHWRLKLPQDSGMEPTHGIAPKGSLRTVKVLFHGDLELLE